MRVILPLLLMFVAPFVVYGLWRRYRHGEAYGREMMNDAPIFILMATGLVLVAAGLFHLASFDRRSYDGVYVPPSVVDGKLVPGHFEKQPGRKLPAPVPEPINKVPQK